MHHLARLPVILAGFLLLNACSGGGEQDSFLKTYISGRISVESSLDTLRNYEGFELRIAESVSGQEPDTLFHAVTDRDGRFDGEARFPQRDIYTLVISRHGDEVAGVNLVLAESDTILFNIEFPDVNNSLVIQSAENDIYQSYERLQAGINRIFRFANAGMVTPDTLEIEVRKWSNLFWDFYEKNRGSYGGRASAASSVRLLEGLDSELMMQRLNYAVQEDDTLVPFASRIGTRYYSDHENLDSALAYIDTLSSMISDERTRMRLKMNRINLLYDSARVRSARLELDQFREQFSNQEEASVWAERFEYDLTSLAPGSDMPDFEITSLDGEMVSSESMEGSSYIIEFTRLDNLLYQQQFDRNVAIYHIYKNYGLNYITIPFGAGNVVLNAFFEERARLWTFARPGSFDAGELQNQFNINIIPTRILVDRRGKVVRKYEGTEFDDILRGLQVVLNTSEEEEPS